MKKSKVGILKKKVGPGSDVLEQEAKRMEQKLSELREFMQQQKQARENAPRQKDGSRWRSGTTQKPISGYSELVMSYKPRPNSKKSQKPKQEYVPTNSLIPQESNNQVLEFLNSCGMQKYHSLFIENGIDDMEIVMELNEEHLSNLGVPLGHRLKILKRVRETNKEPKEPKQPPKELPKEPTKESTTEMGSEHYEPLPAPSATTETGVGVSVSESEFNDGENYQMFREALDNFRKSGSATQHKPSEKSIEEKEFKKVRFTDPITPEMLPKTQNILYDGAWNPSEAVVAKETSEEGTEPNGSMPIMNDKKSCWSCFKIFCKDQGVKGHGKDFCSFECLDKFLSERQVACSCGEKFLKGEGVLGEGGWYCSEKCLPPPSSPELNVVIDPLTGDPIEDKENFSLSSNV